MNLHYLLPRFVNEARMTATYPYYFDDGSEILVEVDIRYFACPKCGGKGKHVDLDKAEDLDWNNLHPADQDQLEAGTWDVTCIRCEGRRVVIGIDESQCGLEMLEQFRAREKQLKEAALEIRRIADRK